VFNCKALDGEGTRSDDAAWTVGWRPVEPMRRDCANLTQMAMAQERLAPRTFRKAS
jgi:hypothetical protein